MWVMCVSHYSKQSAIYFPIPENVQFPLQHSFNAIINRFICYLICDLPSSIQVLSLGMFGHKTGGACQWSWHNTQLMFQGNWSDNKNAIARRYCGPKAELWTESAWNNWTVMIREEMSIILQVNAMNPDEAS